MSTLQKYELEHPLTNAAGTCRRRDEVDRFAKSALAAVMVGSITKEARGGNPGSIWACQEGYTLNSLGMPNLGVEYYQRELPDMARAVHDAGKPLVVSVAGFSPPEYLELAMLALESGADFVELNLGCPNIWADGEQKPIPSFNLGLMGEILRLTKEEADPQTVGVKISPYSNPEDREIFARFLKEEGGHLAFVTATNTFPNALAYGGNGKPLMPDRDMPDWAAQRSSLSRWRMCANLRHVCRIRDFRSLVREAFLPAGTSWNTWQQERGWCKLPAAI